jgi:hypothetical protein
VIIGAVLQDADPRRIPAKRLACECVDNVDEDWHGFLKKTLPRRGITAATQQKQQRQPSGETPEASVFIR